MKPHLTVILVNWNASAKTVRMIESLDEPDFDLRIEILDNASEPADFHALAKAVAAMAHVRLTRSRRNLGFGRANNLLLRRSLVPDGFSVIANNDMVSRRGAITEIIRAMQEAGRQVATSTVCYLDRPHTIWYGGGTNRVEPRFRHRHAHIGQPVSVLAQARPQDVGFASGAWLVIENRLFRKTYLFDKRFFFGEEDSEFCDRLARLGIPVLFVPAVVVHHEVGVSSNSRGSAVLHCYHMASKAYNAGKCLHPLLSPFYILLFIMFQLCTPTSRIAPRQILHLIVKAYLQGYRNRGENHALL